MRLCEAFLNENSCKPKKINNAMSFVAPGRLGHE
jgi:hypothetical protein